MRGGAPPGVISRPAETHILHQHSALIDEQLVLGFVPTLHTAPENHALHHWEREFRRLANEMDRIPQQRRSAPIVRGGALENVQNAPAIFADQYLCELARKVDRNYVVYALIAAERNDAVAIGGSMSGHAMPRSSIESSATADSAPDALAECRDRQAKVQRLARAAQVEMRGWRGPLVTPKAFHPAERSLRSSPCVARRGRTASPACIRRTRDSASC
jgi:hypothetical protein